MAVVGGVGLVVDGISSIGERLVNSHVLWAMRALHVWDHVHGWSEVTHVGLLFNLSNTLIIGG